MAPWLLFIHAIPCPTRPVWRLQLVTAVTSMETMAVTSIETMATKTMAMTSMETMAGREVRAAVFQAWYGCPGQLLGTQLKWIQEKEKDLRHRNPSFFVAFCSSSSRCFLLKILKHV